MSTIKDFRGGGEHMKKSTIALIIVFVVASFMGVALTIGSVVAIRRFAFDWVKVLVDDGEFSWDDSDFVFKVNGEDEVDIDMPLARVYVNDNYVYVQIPFLVVEVDEDGGVITAKTEDFDGPRIPEEDEDAGDTYSQELIPTISSEPTIFQSDTAD